MVLNWIARLANGQAGHDKKNKHGAAVVSAATYAALLDAVAAQQLERAEAIAAQHPALLCGAAPGSNKLSAFHLAAAAGAPELLLRLHALAANRNGDGGGDNAASATTACAAAAAASGASSVDVDVRDAEGRTPLMLAAKFNHAPCVELLLALGADGLRSVDRVGRGAVHHAALGGRAALDALLLFFEDNAEAAADDGQQQQQQQQQQQLVNAADAHGLRPLHFAAWARRGDAAAALLARGADLWARSSSDCYSHLLPCNRGSTALHVCGMRGSEAVVAAVLSFFASQPAAARLAAWRPDASAGAPAPASGSGNVAVAVAVADPRAALDARGKTPLAVARGRGANPALLALLDVAEPLPRPSRGSADDYTDADAADELPSPPPSLTCPITRELMTEPVVASDGHSYERAAIARWLAVAASRGRRANSPMTNLALASGSLFPNHALRAAIGEWREQQQQQQQQQQRARAAAAAQ